jgi:outer membrane protein OmpA-like peptidoglycan-associated protein
LLNSPKVDSNLLSNVGGLFAGGGAQARAVMGTGSSLLTSLLGDKAGGMASALASVAGLRSSQSATNLMALVVPLVLAFLKKYVGANALNAGGLASLLGGQGQYLQGALDSRLTNALGFANPAALVGALSGKAGDTLQAAGAAAAGAAGKVADSAQRAGTAAADAAADAARTGFGRIWPWILGAIVVLALLLWMSRCSQPVDKPVSQAVPPAPTPAPAAPAPTPPAAPIVATLPAKVYFDAGATALGADGSKVVAAAADLIKKDGSKVDVTGYADATGDTAKNAELAKDRAKVVRDGLVAAGVPDANVTLKPPATTTGTGNDAEARRVEITKSM